MSGNLRFVPPDLPPEKHDHFDLVLPTQILRFADPRRFGVVLWQPGRRIWRRASAPGQPGGRTPVRTFTATGYMQPFPGAAGRSSRPDGQPSGGRHRQHLCVGKLFRAGISPLRAANRISRARYEVLVPAIRATLSDAIAGGSSIRDYVHSDGGAGCFQIQAGVYDRAGEPCCAAAGWSDKFARPGEAPITAPVASIKRLLQAPVFMLD
jgi:formamidopyrimidine-DNA glycosylase